MTPTKGMQDITNMGWLRLVGFLKIYVSFTKEPYKRDYILQKRPVILRSLIVIATPYDTKSSKYIHTQNTKQNNTDDTKGTTHMPKIRQAHNNTGDLSHRTKQKTKHTKHIRKTTHIDRTTQMTQKARHTCPKQH